MLKCCYAVLPGRYVSYYEIVVGKSNGIRVHRGASKIYNGVGRGSDAMYSKEGTVLFNDTLNTFYLRLYGVGHMVEDHYDSERGNPLFD